MPALLCFLMFPWPFSRPWKMHKQQNICVHVPSCAQQTDVVSELKWMPLVKLDPLPICSHPLMPFPLDPQYKHCMGAGLFFGKCYGHTRPPREPSYREDRAAIGSWAGSDSAKAMAYWGSSVVLPYLVLIQSSWLASIQADKEMLTNTTIPAP